MKTVKHKINNNECLRIDFLTENIARIRISETGEFTDSLLNRYGFIAEPKSKTFKLKTRETKKDFVASSPELGISYNGKTGELQVNDSERTNVLLRQTDVSYNQDHVNVKFKADPEEDWIGFGDQTREHLYHRGHTVNCQVLNVSSYIPVPFFMSTNGTGVIVNTTHHIEFDMCHSEPDNFFWQDKRGVIDYYVMVGKDFRNLIDLYTTLTGKPKLPPEWSFGLWYICRTQANDYEAVNDAFNFRREEIPCDVIGLEPGWMEKNYDESIEKEWSKERFPIPSYCVNGPHNFFNCIKRMGYHFELWLCNDYDLLYEEERRVNRQNDSEKNPENTAAFHENAELDEHFCEPRRFDKYTQKEEPWFDHLKKFVDQGVDFFKQDGAYQVLEHPDRVWGDKMHDQEVHNLYPLLYSRQMHEGFAEHTGRRPVVFTPAGWIGFQAWCGTWTGDTGGRLDTLGAMLNTSIVGHSWSTNDMEVTEKEGIHFGYLQPWSQINSWNYFRMPWIQGKELSEMHKFYARFRARLIPYLYSWAYQSTLNGYPMMIPLTLEFPEETACRENLHQYLLGRDLMVVIYKNNTYFPEGKWHDFWTGKTIIGPAKKKISWPENRGGGLYIREGGIIPFGPLMQYRKEKPLDEIELYVFPGNQESSFDFYEDDGVSLKHLDGEFSVTPVTVSRNKNKIKIKIGQKTGNYPEREPKRTWNLKIVTEQPPSEITINQQRIDKKYWDWNSRRHELTINDCLSFQAKN